MVWMLNIRASVVTATMAAYTPIGCLEAPQEAFWANPGAFLDRHKCLPMQRFHRRFRPCFSCVSTV